MKRGINLMLGFLFIVNACFCQTNKLNRAARKYRFLYIVQFYDSPPVATENVFIAPFETDTLYMLPKNKIIDSLLKIDEIMCIRVKRGIKIFTLNDVYSSYGINKKYKKLNIMINEDLIDHPETILISKSQIETVKLAKGANGYYVSIILKGYYAFKKKYPRNGDFVD